MTVRGNSRSTRSRHFSLTNTIAKSVNFRTEQIEQALQSYAQFGEGCPVRLNEAIRYSLLGGGKRIRPLLTLFAAHACGATEDAGLPAACAVEMVHTYSLIHDDLPAMDNDSLRRGQPTCHLAFDEATAILAGDALLTRAFEILATAIQPAETAAACCAELAVAAGARNLVGGQCDDLSEKLGTTPHDLEWIHRRKTGALLCASLRLGAMVGQANASQLARLTAFGTELGLAFQIVDDLLDQSGSLGDMGKAPGRDAKQGKRTFPDLIGIDASRQRAKQLYQSACGHLAEFGNRASPLIELAKFIVERNH